MTILNLATIAKIQFIAECAHEDVALTTLKNAKDGITNRSKIHAGYESQWAGVDRAEVLAAFEQPMDCRTKSDFSRRLELLLETMQNMVIEHEKAAEARRAAEAHQRTVMQYTGADFSDELYDAHTEALDEEHARNAEAMQVTFWGANDYAARRAIVEAAHAEALEWDRATDSTWLGHSAQGYFELLTTDTQRRKAINAAHVEALAQDRVYDVMHADFVDPAHRTATAPAPAADIDAIDIRTLHEPIEDEAALPYAAKVVTRAYVARSIARALASYTKHHAKYTAQDRLWLADHNANHAHRNGVITGEEYAAIYHLCRAEGADPLKLIDAVRVALLTGWPVMPAVNAAAGETTAA